jgi:2-amino-4-hydroxy-6-hydroxymethyldihydropteridine diphosphokinase
VILIGLGANLPGPDGAGPRDTLSAALDDIAAAGVVISGRSGWYATAPVPASDQPDYVNAVAALETTLEPGALLDLLHGIEGRRGRVRSTPNAARAIDLDLLDHHGTISSDWPMLPHPRMHLRAFVLRPLLDVAPDWTHPVSGETGAALLACAPDLEDVRPLVE